MNAPVQRPRDLLTLPWSRVDVLLILLLGALVALFFWRILTPNPADRAQFPPGDFTDQFYAFRLYEARALAEGHIPLWSENYNSGHPFLADIQSAVFYPVALANTLLQLALFNSFSLPALELEALLHFWLAGGFTYLFARRVLRRTGLNFVRAGAFTGAVVFTFGGYLTSYPSLQLAILETAAWLPLALCLLDSAIVQEPEEMNDPKADRRPQALAIRPANLIAAGLVLGIAALAGHPQTFFFVVGVCVVYWIYLCWHALGANAPNIIRSPRGAFAALFPVVLLIGVALGIAAVQLVPAVEYQQLSTREALSFADAAKGFPTLDLLQFILPGYASAFASPLYVGILPLWLAIYALVQRKREHAFWGLVALGALILSFGFYIFAYVVFYLLIPGASLFRDQERLALVVSLALAMLAAYGMVDLLNQLNLDRARQLYGLLPAGFVLTLVLLVTFFVAGVQTPQGRLSFLGDRAGLMVLVFGLTAVLVGLYLRKRVSAPLFGVLAIVLILFDLWSVSEPANKGRVQDRFAEIPFAGALRQDPELFRVAAEDQVLPGHFGIPTGLEEISGISPLRLARYDALLKGPAQVVYALLNVKYAIGHAAPAAGADKLADDGDLTLYHLNHFQPRAWLVGSASLADDAGAATALTDTFDPSQQALLAAPPPFVLDPRAATGSVAVIQHTAERMTLEVNAPADGLLVISENFYPGWRATLDGQPVEILRADLTLRGLPIRAGQHRVEIWYEPFSFQFGAVVSGIALLSSLGGIVYFGRRPGERAV